MRAEREKRAVILTSEGERDAAINTAEGEKQQVIKASEARKQQQINEAQGQAAAILAVATATAEGIKRGRRGDHRPTAGTTPCSCAWPSSTSRSSANIAQRQHDLVLPANVERRRLDDRAGDERLQPADRDRAIRRSPDLPRGSDPGLTPIRPGSGQTPTAGVPSRCDHNTLISDSSGVRPGSDPARRLQPRPRSPTMAAVMAHVTARSAYAHLVDRLNQFPQGAPPSDLLYRILGLLRRTSASGCATAATRSSTSARPATRRSASA